MPHPVIGARHATPSVNTARYDYSQKRGLAGFREAIGKLERSGSGFAPELFIDKNGNPRIDRGPQGPVDWIISFVKDLIFPDAQTAEREKTLHGLEEAIKSEMPVGENSAVQKGLNHAWGMVKDVTKAGGKSIDTYNAALRAIESELARAAAGDV